MLNNVPIAINKASRNITLRHPNSMDCAVYRKVLLRTDEGELGGIATLGGLAVLRGDDEPDFEYQELGPGKIHFEGGATGNVSDNDDSTVSGDVMVLATIESIVEGAFNPSKGDLVATMPGGGVVIAYEVTGTDSSVNIYPYVKKYQLAPRDELHHLEPWAE